MTNTNTKREPNIFGEFKAMGMNWKLGNGCFYAEPTHNFWLKWRSDKAKLKAQGFFVKKLNDCRFIVFYKEPSHLPESNRSRYNNNPNSWKRTI